MAQPRKDTPELLALLTEHLANGVPIKTACKLVGIDHKTYRRWKLEQGATAGMLDRAEAAGENNIMGVIRKQAMGGDWKAAAWIMERCYGFTMKTALELTGEDGGPVEVNVADARERLASRIAGIATRTTTPTSD